MHNEDRLIRYNFDRLHNHNKKHNYVTRKQFPYRKKKHG